jgi:hypothetical protein
MRLISCGFGFHAEGRDRLVALLHAKERFALVHAGMVLFGVLRVPRREKGSTLNCFCLYAERRSCRPPGASPFERAFSIREVLFI